MLFLGSRYWGVVSIISGVNFGIMINLVMQEIYMVASKQEYNLNYTIFWILLGAVLAAYSSFIFWWLKRLATSL